MSVRIGINGFGRIGRNFFRALLDQVSLDSTSQDLQVVAINDLTVPATLAHLLRFDSTHGRLCEPVHVEGDELLVGSHRIKVLCERDPKALPWDELDIDVVIESTGLFTAREKAAAHLEAGAKRVIISGPSDDADGSFVMGVNSTTFDPDQHFVISNASCTTNCFVPMVKVLDDAFSITTGLMTTVHAYTNDQQILDLMHRDLRRARSAAINIIPASTGAAKATGLVLASMKGKLDGGSLRVPVPVGSITDFTAVIASSVTVDDVNRAFLAAASKAPLEGFLIYCEEPIVSSDIVGSPASCTFDALLTMVQRIDDSSTLVKVQGWYDNEWGYSSRLVDLCRVVGEKTGSLNTKSL